VAAGKTCSDQLEEQTRRSYPLTPLSRWEGLTRFIDDGRIELDDNTVERSIRPTALNRKNALFAGPDGGAEHWATIASLIETCKLNDVDPLASENDAYEFYNKIAT
jgi:hypothetical protein